MINTPEPNIKFTDEQAETLNAYNTRISQAQTDISIADSRLGVLNKEIIKATKEREYQEEQLGTLGTLVADKRVELSKLEASIAEQQKQAEIDKVVYSERLAELERKEADLSIRADAVATAENGLAVRGDELKEEEARQIEERAKLIHIKEAFKDAIMTVDW